MPDAPATRSEAMALLRAAIDRAGLSASEYARAVLIRDPRTLRRWLSGESPIPQSVLDHLTRQAGDRHPTGSDDTSSPASPLCGVGPDASAEASMTPRTDRCRYLAWKERQ